MIPLVVIGALLGLSLFAVVLTLAPPRPSVLVQLGRFDAVHHQSGSGVIPVPRREQGGDTGNAALQLRAGRWLATELNRHGIGYRSLRQNVALAGRSYEAVLGRKVMLAVVGFLAGMAVLVVAQFDLGVALPFGTPMLVGLLAAVVFFFAPDAEIGKSAETRRWEFRQALLVYMDLVALHMSGQAAPSAAMTLASKSAGCWPVVLIRTTLLRASREPGRRGWAALADLGEQIGVTELRDLGLAMRLVADDGAKVRETLIARSATLREHLLAEEEGLAAERSQSMSMAQLLVAGGLIVFITFPAIMTVLQLRR